MKVNVRGASPADVMRFFTLIGSPEQERHARLLIDSLRTFGGRLKECPVWVFVPEEADVARDYAGLGDVHVEPLAQDDGYPRYFFAQKVRACALAEEMAGDRVRSLAWVGPQCLVFNPPLLFDLAPSSDAALRTVHHRNVGSLAGEPLDGYWEGVYRHVGLDDAPFTVESYVDSQTIRPYFNTHLFSIDPSRGLLRTWKEAFADMVTDQAFQSQHCSDEAHQIFLHQAVLCALVAKHLPRERIRELPPEYSYPLHFHDRVPEGRRPEVLNSLVCPVYEEVYRYPDTLRGMEVREPLKSWLAERVSAEASG